MADNNLAFNTAEGQAIKRSMLILYLNTGTTDAPTWSPVGKRVESSNMEFDWGRETKNDILGNAWSSMKAPTITQSFDPWELANGDDAQLKVWKTAIHDHDVQALCNMDMLVVHLYAGTSDTAAFAERYSACAVEPSSLGGDGGGNIAMPVNVTYGGARSIGTASVKDGTVSFVPDI